MEQKLTTAERVQAGWYAILEHLARLNKHLPKVSSEPE